MPKGKFIVFYGVNNLGKTTQAKLLVDKLNGLNYPAQYVKYHLYDLEPSGPIINSYLRGANPYRLSAREFQLVAVVNKLQYEPELMRLLNNGTNVVAEDYWGTGVAWGVGAGVDKDFLLRIYSKIYPEDLAFLFTGQRFVKGIEQQHLHENDNVLTEKVAKAHEELAAEFKWVKINANQTIENVSADIWQAVNKIL